MNVPLHHPPRIPAQMTHDWAQDRLTEARHILADTTQHSDALLILAARVVVGLTHDARECGDALEVLRLLDQRPLHAVAKVALPKGGVA